MVTETQSPSPLPQVTLIQVTPGLCGGGNRYTHCVPTHNNQKSAHFGKFHDFKGTKKGLNLRVLNFSKSQLQVANLSSYFPIVRCAEFLNIPTTTGLKNRLKRSSMFAYKWNSALKFIVQCNDLLNFALNIYLYSMNLSCV